MLETCNTIGTTLGNLSQRWQAVDEIKRESNTMGTTSDILTQPWRRVHNISKQWSVGILLRILYSYLLMLRLTGASSTQVNPDHLAKQTKLTLAGFEHIIHTLDTQIKASTDFTEQREQVCPRIRAADKEL